jgi:hypothetical protein
MHGGAIMSALSLAGGAVVGGIWKVAAIALAGLLVVTATGFGGNWWMAARDRDKAEAALTKERGASAALRASITIQNSAVDAMALSVAAADERRDLAERYAATAIKATGARQAAARASAATTCDGVLREAWGQR